MKKNIRTFAFYLAAALCVSVSTGCATAKLTTMQPVLKTPPQVAVRITGYSKKSPGKVEAFRYMVDDSLRSNGILTAFSNDKTVPLLTGQVTVLDPGDRVLRYVAGFGAGKGRLASIWTLKDENGKQIGACRIDGSISMGILGGDYDGVLKKAGDRVADFLTGDR